MSFQNRMNRDVPVAVEGDFASTNPYHTLLAGEGALKAGVGGVTVGRFAWVNIDTGFAVNQQIKDAALGFARRGDNIATIYEISKSASMIIPQGYGVTLYDKGDFWARFEGGAKYGQKVLANIKTGLVSAADVATDNDIDTGFVVASNTDAGGLAKITK